jgi:hypothetical protein
VQVRFKTFPSPMVNLLPDSMQDPNPAQETEGHDHASRNPLPAQAAPAALDAIDYLGERVQQTDQALLEQANREGEDQV